MQIIADSGSTKTTWLCIDTASKTQSEPITMLGINPVRDDADTITKAVQRAQDALVQANGQGASPLRPTHVHFYGAGCIPPYSTTVRRVLEQTFPRAQVHVESDMLGAARALCGHHEGIACILGTGSNSCLFDGTNIVRQTPALGFILGDEGSGASLGKRLVGDVLKGQLPEHLRQAFLDEQQLTQSDIIGRVYRQPQPNMFLASLTPFLARHIDDEAIHSLLLDEFRRFLSRNVRAYQRPDLPVHFVGGITATFQSPLEEALAAEGMQLGCILARPISGMADYHLQG